MTEYPEKVQSYMDDGFKLDLEESNPESGHYLMRNPKIGQSVTLHLNHTPSERQLASAACGQILSAEKILLRLKKDTGKEEYRTMAIGLDLTRNALGDFAQLPPESEFEKKELAREIES